ncbi:MAG: hypothetical protein OJI67_05170, partial [Prosthecobacter sp.]|nr:hypothetical protein [Prosthecobacter sp.]
MVTALTIHTTLVQLNLDGNTKITTPLLNQIAQLLTNVPARKRAAEDARLRDEEEARLKEEKRAKIRSPFLTVLDKFKISSPSRDSLFETHGLKLSTLE